MAGRQLVFVQQPTRVRIPNAISPPVRLEVRTWDIIDPRVIDGEVTIGVLSGPPGGRIVGTAKARCPDGVAVFDDLRFNVPGTYTLIAECDEDKLEAIPRPSAYRYFGNFHVTENEQVQIAGDGVTTGVVAEVGDGWIVIRDDSSTPQQSVVAGANAVEIEGILGNFEATDWFSADSPGIDTSGSAAVWTVEGLEAVEALGRFGSMVPAEVPGSPPIFNIPSPLGPDKALVMDYPDAQYALTASGDVPEIDVCPIGEPGTTFLMLGTYSPPGIHNSDRMAWFETENTQSRGSVTLLGLGNEEMGPRFGIQGGTQGPSRLKRRSKRSWWLIGLRVFRVGENQRRMDVWVDGSFLGTYYDTYSSGGSPTVLRRVQHMITKQTSFSQIGVYEGAREPEWHLEQARRCGVAP